MGETKNKSKVKEKEKKTKSQIGKRNRRVGHDFERKIVRVLKTLGYDKAMTTRRCSQLLDDMGIDIAPNGPLVDGISLLIQCKKGYEKSRPKADVLFKQMNLALAAYFPSDHDIWKATQLLMHELGPKEEEQLVTMKMIDWVETQKRLMKLEAYEEVEQEQQNRDTGEKTVSE